MAEPVKRLHYFDHQFLREDDFTDEQAYHVRMRREHNRLLHTWGVADGLEVAFETGATAVTVRQGTAFDSLGREIVLAEDTSVELEAFPDDASVYVTIAYDEEQTDPTGETGVSGNTRWTETPQIGRSESAPTDPGQELALALVSRSGTEVTGVDESDRRAAGVVAGDLEVRSLTLSDPSVASSQWPRLQLGAANRADVEGSLRVSEDLNVAGTVQGNLANGSVGTNQLAIDAVTNPKIANNAIDAAKIQNGTVGAEELAPSAVTGAKIANNTINEVKLDAATRGRLVTNGNSHDHSGGDGGTIRHSALNKDDGSNPHATTAADVGALPASGGSVTGSISTSRSYTPPPPDTVDLSTVFALRGSVLRDPPPPPPPFPFFIPIKAAVIGTSNAEGVSGVYASAPSGTHALFVNGTARFTGAKTGYVVDLFVNKSGQRLRTGDVVKLKGTPIARFQGDNNKIPVAEVTLADRETDTMVIGIVDREAALDPDMPDSRVEPDDPTSIEDGGELYVVTLGTYAHCKADAAEAPIEVGDLLTTSARPGYAKRASDPKLGSIIGKALEPLAEGTGYIAVFVNIQ